jgi:hypothetical protein
MRWRRVSRSCRNRLMSSLDAGVLLAGDAL